MDSSQRETEKKHFFINICHRVLQEGLARGCPEDAAACSVGELCPERGITGVVFPEACGTRLHLVWSELENLPVVFMLVSSLWVQHIQDGEEKKFMTQM